MKDLEQKIDVSSKEIMPDLITSFPNNGLAVPEGSIERVSTADIIVFLGSDKEIYGL